MIRVAVVHHHSGSGHTARQANAVARGARLVADVVIVAFVIPRAESAAEGFSS